MMGGIDLRIGVHYQDCIGVLRILQLKQDAGLMELEFESVNEELSDINMFYPGKRLVLEQVKKKDDGHWTPSKIGSVITHFVEKWRELKSSFELDFVFTTYESANGRLKDMVRRIHNLKTANKALDIDLRGIRTIFPDDLSDEEIVDVAKRLSFIWNEGAPQKVEDNPTNEIVRKCQDILVKEYGVDEAEKESVFSKLHKQVVDHSMNKNLGRRYSRKDLALVLPGSIDIESNLLNLGLPDGLLQVLTQQDITYTLQNTPLKEGGETFTAHVFIKTTQSKCVIWILRETATQAQIHRISRIIDKAIDYKHMIICLSETIDDYDFGKKARERIIRPRNPERLVDVLRM